MTGGICQRSAIAGIFLFVFGAAGAVQAQTAETTRRSLHPAANGTYPNSVVLRDANGNLYGTTQEGGTAGLGTVYKVDAAGNGATLYSFVGGNFGKKPSGGLSIDSAGNVYGTAQGGGTGKTGVVYKLDQSGQQTVLYRFTGGTDGRFPYNGVILDPAGNLYGTTHKGGTSNQGIVFKVDAAGNETVLYRFPGGASGSQPSSGVTLDPAGNLYGVTRYGGAHNHGVVYKLDTAGNETVLHNFGNLENFPSGNLALDNAGNLYGITYGAKGAASPDKGTVYKVTTAGTKVLLHRFHGGADGALPVGDVVVDANGNVFGATEFGGAGGFGVVYEVSAAGVETLLHSFNYTVDGGPPTGVVLDSAGNLYGSTSAGGPNSSDGTLFLLSPGGQETVLYDFLP